MKTTLLDPVSMHRVSDTPNVPNVIEGSGVDAIKIYSENERYKVEHVENAVHETDNCLPTTYTLLIRILQQRLAERDEVRQGASNTF